MQIDSQQIVTRKYILNVLQNVSSKALIFYIDTQSSEKKFWAYCLLAYTLQHKVFLCTKLFFKSISHEIKELLALHRGWVSA